MIKIESKHLDLIRRGLLTKRTMLQKVNKNFQQVILLTNQNIAGGFEATSPGLDKITFLFMIAN